MDANLIITSGAPTRAKNKSLSEEDYKVKVKKRALWMPISYGRKFLWGRNFQHDSPHLDSGLY